MKSPHSRGIGPYQDLYIDRIIHPEEERLITLNYKFLGWHMADSEVAWEYKKCLDEAHNYYSAFPNAWHSVNHNPDGSDTTQWCTNCRIYWKVDLIHHALS